MLIAAHALAGRGSPGLHLLLAPVLFLLGTFLGAMSGVLFAVVGRGSDVPRADAFRRARVGAGAGLLLLPLSWLISAAIVVGTALQAEFRVSWLVVSLGGAVLGMLVGGWACREGWEVARTAYGRVHNPSTAAPPSAAVRELRDVQPPSQ